VFLKTVYKHIIHTYTQISYFIISAYSPQDSHQNNIILPSTDENRTIIPTRIYFAKTMILMSSSKKKFYRYYKDDVSHVFILFRR